MKNKLSALLLVLILCSGFVSCTVPLNSSNSETAKSSENSESSLRSDTSDSQQTPVTPTEPEIPEDEISDFLSALALGNFTFETQTDEGLAKYYFQDDSLFTKVGDNWGVYYVYENDKMVRLEYQEDIQKYYKYNETNLLSFDSILYDALVSTDWKSYDEATDTVTGETGSLEYSLNLTDKTLSGDINGRVYDIGSTQVLMPTYIVDKTNETVTPDDPTIIDPTPTESENIYEVVNGEYVFDVVAIKDVLLNWMKGDNQYGKDFMVQLGAVGENSTKDLIYVKADQTEFQFGVLYEDNGKSCFVAKNIQDEAFYQKLVSEEIKTCEQFKTYLNSTKWYNFANSIDAVEIDTEISDENFETLTENAFKRLEEKGTQGSSVNNDYPETKLENFSDAEVLYGFKGVSSAVGAGFDLGWNKIWHQYYLVKYNNNYEFIDIKISSSTSSPSGVETELDNVLNNSDWWIIQEILREEVNADNNKLYSNSSTALLNANYSYKENKRELI